MEYRDWLKGQHAPGVHSTGEFCQTVMPKVIGSQSKIFYHPLLVFEDRKLVGWFYLAPLPIYLILVSKISNSVAFILHHLQW